MRIRASSTVLFFAVCTAAVGQTSFWTNSAVPVVAEATSDSKSVTLGLRFTTDVGGIVNGVRFYKGIGNTGPHSGQLWSSTGVKLAEVTFTSETASGWQQAQFATPVPIQANTPYVVSYVAPFGHYAFDQFFAWSTVPTSPLRVSGSEPGVYAYGSTPSFPAQAWNATNYWVDVIFTPLPLATNLQSFWPEATLPSNVNGTTDTTSVTLGLKFSSDVPGKVVGVRFHKGRRNLGPHVGALWSSAGALLTQVTFHNESASGWQQANFATPVSIQPNTGYVISYTAPRGYYSMDQSYAWSSVRASPLHVSTGAPGVYANGSTLRFPSKAWKNSNYWVDVVFQPDTGTTPPLTYIISGNVGGTPATVTLSGTSGGTTTTDGTGAYRFEGLSNGSYVVAPSATGFTFTPSSSAVSINNGSLTSVNFAAVVMPVARSVALSWTASASPGVAGYNVYRAVGGGSLSKINVTLVSGTTFIDNSVINGQTYTYVVTSVDSTAESSYSSSVSATIPM